MFNGIIYKTGLIKYIKKENKYFLIGINSNFNFQTKDIGSSISCNGVCLTIFNVRKNMIYFYVSKESLDRTNLKKIRMNDIINIEKSLIHGQKISGHYVQGHVDTTANVKKITIKGETWIVKFILKDKKLYKFLVEKASISINGVSLTISKIYNRAFEINIIPHTLKLTNLKNLKSKDIVNIELDIFAKYVLKVSN